MAALTTDDLRELVASVGSMAPAVDDADRIERLRQFEQLKAACAAAQAAVAVDFDRSQRAAAAMAGVPAARQGRGVAAQVALALRVSPWQGQRWLGWAKILTAELPGTLAELAAGRTTEWRAMLVARETAVLSRKDRAAVDTDLAPRLEGWGDRQVEAETRKAAYRLDPAGAVERARNAETDRRVTIRPAPDTMCRISALLPVGQGVATYAALKIEADRLIGIGDADGGGRSRGQIMADTLVERVTGQATATAVPVEINLVISDETFLNTGQHREEPAWIDGYGPVPAGWARDLAHNQNMAAEEPTAGQAAGRRWIRRLYTRRGRLVAMDTDRRLFTSGQQRFIRRRDHGTCRTPWCGAPIRHIDHIRPHSRGGPTTVDNGQGLCEACNHARQALYWHSAVHPDGTITTRTPTGHAYRSRPPDITGPPTTTSPLERRLAALLAAA